MIRERFLAAVIAVFLLPASVLGAKPAPAFGDSISWHGLKEEPTLDALRGKSVLVVFFQSWCGICNGWSGEMFRQVEQAYGDNPNIVLVALKTDGGGTKEAMSYLGSRTNTDKWLVGADENASYYQQATGDDKLYTYLWVKPDGSVGEVAKSGMFTTGSNPKRFSLAEPRNRDKFLAGSSPLFAAGEFQSEAIQPAVALAERGLFLSALSAASKASSKPDAKAEVAKFRGKLLESLQSAVARNKAALEDETNENRFPCYQILTRMARDYGSSAPGKAASEAVRAHSSAAWLEKEQEAFDDYQSIMRRKARADDSKDMARISRALAKLAAEFPGTYYGRIAAR